VDKVKISCGRIQGPNNFISQRTYSSTTCSGSLQVEAWYAKNACVETDGTKKRLYCENSDVQSVTYTGSNCTGTPTKNTYNTYSCVNAVVVGARFNCGAAATLKIVSLFTFGALIFVLV